MKKFKLLFIVALVSLVFASCSSSDEVLSMEESSKDLVQTYQLKRDATGAYSLDLQVEDDISITKFKNITNNTNELYLSTVEGVAKKTSYGSNLMFEDENFKIELISENSNTIPSISVVDDNIVYAQKSSNDYLNEYSISKNEEGSYDLDFTVNDAVSVDFVYDEESDIYEVHLGKSESSQKSNTYSKTFEKQSLLQIHFVNHNSYSAKGELESLDRKPVIIIDEGEDW